MGRLAEIFVRHLPPEMRHRQAGDELERALEQAVASGRTAHPDLTLSEERFTVFLAAKVTDDAENLSSLCHADLFLAWACLERQSNAIAAASRLIDEAVGAAGASLGAQTSLVEEVAQALRTRLLVGEDGDASEIRSYAGRGRLGGWIRVTAVRDMVRLLRRGRREVTIDAALLGDVSTDPEVERMKELYRDEFRTAFADALGALRARARTLLRHQIVDNLNIDQIGAIYRVHRATAARWLAQARAELVGGTSERMMERLKISPDSVESVIRLVRSQLDVSVVRLLVEGEPKNEDG
jgi:RNA polymerase sigma-70 factor (ECF subfamily)